MKTKTKTKAKAKKPIEKTKVAIPIGDLEEMRGFCDSAKFELDRARDVLAALYEEHSVDGLIVPDGLDPELDDAHGSVWDLLELLEDELEKRTEADHG